MSKPSYFEISQIPHLRTLQSRLREAYQGSKNNGLELEIEQLPYTLSATACILLRILDAQMLIIESVKSRTGNDDIQSYNIYQMEEDEYQSISFLMDSYLDAARRAQNAIWPYLSKILRKSVPQSLSDTIKKMSSGKLQFPDRIHALILEYWRKSGSKLKDYRDLSQHHAVVSSEGHVVILPDRRAGIYLILPKNPEEVNLAKLNYDGSVHALPLVVETYIILYSFIY